MTAAPSLKQFIDRSLRLQAVIGAGTPVLDDDGWAELAGAAGDALAELTVAERQQQVTEAWAMVEQNAAVQARADLEYITGTTDFHPLIHADGYPVAYLGADELSGKHLGKTFRSETYPNPKSSADAKAPSVYTVTSIHHLTGGCVLINGAGIYLRPDTRLTMLAAPQAARAAA